MIDYSRCFAVWILHYTHTYNNKQRLYIALAPDHRSAFRVIRETKRG